MGPLAFVETASRFAAEPTCCDILPQKRRRAVLVVAELVVQHFRDRQAGVEADEVGQLERPHRVVETELDALIDVLDRAERLLEREARLVEKWNQEAIDDEAA